LQKSLRLYSADSLTRRTEGRDIVASTLAHANVWMHVRGELIRDEAGEPSIWFASSGHQRAPRGGAGLGSADSELTGAVGSRGRRDVPIG